MELKEGLLGFDTAIQLLKDGCKVTREKWVEQGKFIVYQKGYPKGIPCNKNTAEDWCLYLTDDELAFNGLI